MLNYAGSKLGGMKGPSSPALGIGIQQTHHQLAVAQSRLLQTCSCPPMAHTISSLHASLVLPSSRQQLWRNNPSMGSSCLVRSSGGSQGDGSEDGKQQQIKKPLGPDEAGARSGGGPSMDGGKGEGSRRRSPSQTPGPSQRFGGWRTGEERGKGNEGYSRDNRRGSGGGGSGAAARRMGPGWAGGGVSGGVGGAAATERSGSLDRRSERRGGGQRGGPGSREERSGKGSFSRGFQDEEAGQQGGDGAGPPTRPPKAQRSLLRSLGALRSAGLGLEDGASGSGSDERSGPRGAKGARRNRGGAQDRASSPYGRAPPPDFEVIGYEPIPEKERRQQQEQRQRQLELQRSAAAAASAAQASAASASGAPASASGTAELLGHQQQQQQVPQGSQAASYAATGAAVGAAAGIGGGTAALATAAAADAAAAASATATATLTDKEMEVADFVDECDGARAWMERMGAAGLVYDDEEEEWEDNVDEEEDLEEGEEDMADLLTEAVPYGAWFSGGASDQAEEGVAEETDEQAELSRWYTSQDGYLPPSTWGPVQAVAMKGKGRGLVVSRDVKPGQLLLVCQPLYMLEYVSEGEGKGEDDAPENEELADHMRAKVQLSPAQHTWLDELLCDGRGTKRLPTQEDINALHDPQQGPLSPINMDLERLYRIVNLNCQGEEFKDIAACALRGEEAVGHLGLWPEAALINHSCTPNSTSYVIGDRLIVRATEELAAGEEVTLSYLGRQLTAPLRARQAELAEKFGFEANCPRTRAEQRCAGPGSTLGALLDDTAAWCSELSEVLDTALEDEDMAEVEDIRKELEQRRDEVEAAMRAAKVTSKARRWLQASVYDLYDMISMCADEGEADKGKSSAAQQEPQVLDTEALAVCARILESVARGSDAQVYLAAEYMVRAGVRFGQHHEETQQARRMCRTAYTARYGEISDALLDMLIATRLDD